MLGSCLDIVLKVRALKSISSSMIFGFVGFSDYYRSTACRNVACHKYRIPPLQGRRLGRSHPITRMSWQQGRPYTLASHLA